VLIATSHQHTADLPSNATHFISGTITIPTGTTPGSYFILVEADTLAVVAESNENNNVTATPLTVTGSLLTVTKAGSGSGTVTSSPAGINCGSDCSKPYTQGTVVTLTANPAADSLFIGWSGGGCTGTGVCILTVNADTSVTATFNKIPRTLTVTKAGVGNGTVTSSPAGINCGSTCSASFDSGTSVTLTASPSSGFALASWSGGGCSGTDTCTVTMDANTSVTATFSLVFSLTVTKAGSGDGTVTSSPIGINCGSDCTEAYGSGTSVTLTANPGGGSTFKAWSGACSGTATCTVTMSANRSVTATYSKTFTDDPLTAKVTPVKAKHFLETLEAINALRRTNGLGTISFTAPLPALGVPISAKDMITLQTGLNAVYDALGRARPTFDAIVAGVTVVGKRQMEQVRNAIRAVETVPTQ